VQKSRIKESSNTINGSAPLEIRYALIFFQIRESNLEDSILSTCAIKEKENSAKNAIAIVFKIKLLICLYSYDTINYRKLRR